MLCRMDVLTTLMLHEHQLHTDIFQITEQFIVGGFLWCLLPDEPSD